MNSICCCQSPVTCQNFFDEVIVSSQQKRNVRNVAKMRLPFFPLFLAHPNYASVWIVADDAVELILMDTTFSGQILN